MDALIKQIDCVKEKEAQQNQKIDMRRLLKINKSMAHNIRWFWIWKSTIKPLRLQLLDLNNRQEWKQYWNGISWTVGRSATLGLTLGQPAVLQTTLGWGTTARDRGERQAVKSALQHTVSHEIRSCCPLNFLDWNYRDWNFSQHLGNHVHEI
jgi:hypothetical protein